MRMLRLVVWVSRVETGKPQIDAETLMSSLNLDALSRIFDILNELEQTR